MSDIKTILGAYVSKIKEFSEEGLEEAFVLFQKSLVEKIHESKNHHLGNDDYIKTSLAETAKNAKLPVFITVKENEYGNMESTDYPGLIFVNMKRQTEEGEKDRWIAHALQDGSELRPLDMNVAIVCAGNGWEFDRDNLVGSAQKISSDLKVAIDINS